MSPSSHHVHSPFVLKKDILVPWGMTTLMSRDELLIEWRGQVRQFTCRVPYQAVSAVIHVFDIYRRKIIHTCLTCSVKVFFFFLMCHLNQPEEREGWTIIASAGHFSFAVHSKSAHGEKLMQHCFVAQPCDIYICRDNEIEFHPDWTGWWHQYEIALVFPWLLRAFDKDSLSCLVGPLTCNFFFWAMIGSLKDMIQSI